MIKITSLKLKPDHREADLKAAAAKAAGLDSADILSLKVIKRSIEARKKEPLSLVYSVLVKTEEEEKVKSFLRSGKGKASKCRHSVSFIEKEERYCFPQGDAGAEMMKNKKRPVIIGSGPAGLLCAYELAKHGYRPIVAERGQKVAERTQKVAHFWKTGELDPECNIQFGEGGAGTFSDGKLNTGVTDRYFRAKEVLELFVSCGAPEDILYDAKPHVGSDRLCEMVKNLRERIIGLGGEFRFGKRADDVLVRNGGVTGIRFADGDIIETDTAVFAIGHSARDTFRMLYDRGVKMEPKAFAVGVRCEHDQEMINRNQWGEDYPESLGAAPYKLTHHASNGRSVYTFCMCPGGYVVNASSEEGGLCVNGMSLRGRDSKKANSAVIVSVTPDDFRSGGEIPEELSGIEFQRMLEKKAFREGRGKIPAQRYEDFRYHRVSSHLPESCTKGSIASGNLHIILPDYVCNALIDGMEAFNGKIPGFTDTVFYGVESRTSSPVRILRDETFQSNIKGLFPCGEGAGYAGGIMSAAIDGIKTAEAAARFMKSVT